MRPKDLPRAQIANTGLSIRLKNRIQNFSSWVRRYSGVCLVKALIVGVIVAVFSLGVRVCINWSDFGREGTCYLIKEKFFETRNSPTYYVVGLRSVGSDAYLCPRDRGFCSMRETVDSARFQNSVEAIAAAAGYGCPVE